MKANAFQFVLFAFLVCASSGAQQPDVHRRLTNDDIVKMVQAGLSADVINTKLRAANAQNPRSLDFDTSPGALSALKSAGVPEPVIEVMINPAPQQANIVAAPVPVTLDANLPPPEVGVYWKDESRFVLIEGQALSQSKIGGRAGAMFTYGFRGLHWDAYLNGPHSAHLVKDRRPIFYVYVPDGAGASDYALIKLTEKSDRREFQIGSLSGKMGGGKAGLKRDKEISMQADHVGIRTYRIVLNEDLAPGEYAFVMATGEENGSTGRQGTGGTITGRIYDFRVLE
jgi:hypothetical protein